MTEEFKKGLATGLAIGGVTIHKGGGGTSECFEISTFTKIESSQPILVMHPKMLEPHFEIVTFYNV